MLLDVIIIALLILSILWGYNKGFVGTVIKLLGLIVSIVLAKILYPYLSALIHKYLITDLIADKLTEHSQRIISDNVSPFVDVSKTNIADAIANVIVSVVSFLIIVIITFIIANLILKSLNIVAKLPVISLLNHSLGIFSGLVMGILLAYLVLAVVIIFNVSPTLLQGSLVADYMLEENILMNFIF